MVHSENIKNIVTYPMLGNYHVVIYNLLNKLIDKNITKILPPKKITASTVEKGANASPDFVCLPFKYTLGNYIEALDAGANVLIQAGGGCRYGYYAEIQEQILKDMGYNFTYISLVEGKGLDLKKVFKSVRILNSKLSFQKFAYHTITAMKMLSILDEFECYIRDNISFEQNKGEFDNLHKIFLASLIKSNNLRELYKIKKEFFKKLKSVKLVINENIIKVGIVGELYTSMEPSSTFYMEKELAKMGIQIKRYTTVTYLLFGKSKSERNILKTANKYIEHVLGADGAESVAHSLELIEKGYDGIIHIKPFGCTPEINAMPILQKISQDSDIPIMYLTFDEQTTQTGIMTRLEAFYDMLKMKKDKKSTEIKVNFNETKKVLINQENI